MNPEKADRAEGNERRPIYIGNGDDDGFKSHRCARGTYLCSSETSEEHGFRLGCKKVLGVRRTKVECAD